MAAWLCVVLLAAAPMAWAAPVAQIAPLDLDEKVQSTFDCWPATTVLYDPAAAWSAADVVGRGSQFQAPDTPRANLGIRPGAVWLRVPVVVPAHAEGRWILDIDYPLLEDTEVHVVTDHVVRRVATLSFVQPFSRRPYPSRSLAVELKLEPGHTHELLLRVRASVYLVPLSLSTVAAFHVRETQEWAIQGLMAGVGLCLLLYGLAQWFSLRERIFIDYVINVSLFTVFSATYFGVTQQLFWPESPWMLYHGASLFLNLAEAALARFLGGALSTQHGGKSVRRIFDAIAALSIAASMAFAWDWIDDPTAADIGGAIGPVVVVIAVFMTVSRLRAGDRPLIFLLLGWGVYAVGAIVLSLLFQGIAPATYWVQHSLQFALVVELCAWMLFLGARIRELRSAAQRAHVERDALRSLAHTDPLTGLPNRRGLQEVLRTALPGACADRLVAVYLLDLDGFKAVNDRLGHDAGDALLIAVAQRLQGLLRASDLVARLGGDEFVVVAQSLPNDTEAGRLGHKLLDGIRTPFQIGDQSCEVGLTIGYVLAPLDGSDAGLLLQLADLAMYRGKRAGRHCMRRGTAELAR